MKKIYDVLNKYRNNKVIFKSTEFSFYNKYCEILYDNKNFKKYTEINNLFDLIKSNIIIRIFLNKNTIDKYIKEETLNKKFNTQEQIILNIKKQINNVICMKYKNFNIYIPFFNVETNDIYINHIEKLNSKPYSDLLKNYESFLINPFENYTLNLFESGFTELVKISSDNSSTAYYHYELRTIFIINNQGYLDNIISIFDKKIKNIDNTNLMNRIKVAVEKYYNNDISGFIYSLYEEKLISNKVFRKLCKIKKI